jgi:sugar phosphate isomerase/epimerase
MAFMKPPHPSSPHNRSSGVNAAPVSRRAFFVHAAAGAAAATSASGPLTAAQRASDAAGPAPLRYCLNTSTIRGQEVGLPRAIDIAARAGYQGIEPWIRELQAYVQQGGSLKDLRKRLDDQGLVVESAIGFARWIVDDEPTRAAALDEARRDMEMVAALGGKRIAAPPAGAARADEPLVSWTAAAQRYRTLLELGRQVGVIPQLEVWGFSRTLSRLGEVLLVAAEAAHPDACLLPDVYHLYKGGSDFHALRLVAGGAMHVFHVNDYPPQPDRSTITDAHRVYPGDGVAPLGLVFRTLRDVGFRGALSLELFNRDYWQQDALQVARTGLVKTQEAVARALEGA